MKTLRRIRGILEDSQQVSKARESGRGLCLVLEILKFFVVVTVSNILIGRISEFLTERWITPLSSWDYTGIFCIGFLSVIALVYCALWERMRPRELGLVFRPANRGIIGFIAGYICGAAIMALSIAGVCLSGSMIIAGNLGDADAAAVVSVFAVFVFQAFGEEVMYRGYFLIAMSRKSAAWIALLVSAVVFSLHHHFNNGYGPVAFINLFLLAVLLGTVMLITGRIWASTAIHAAWNFVQGNVFGAAVSGFSAPADSTIMIAAVQGEPLLYGGAMGLEGSIFTTIILVAVLAIMAVLMATDSRLLHSAR